MSEMTREDARQIDELLLRLLDHSIDDEAFAQLEQWLHEDPQAVAHYYEFMQHYAAMKIGIGARAAMASGMSASSCQDVLMSMAQLEKEAPTVEEIPQLQPVSHPNSASPERKPFRVNWKSLLPAVASAAILILALFLIDAYQLPHLHSVATVVDTMQAQWKDDWCVLKKDNRVFNLSQPIEMTAGLVRIRFDDQAEVIIEGPASFACVSPEQLDLRYGRIFCYIPQAASGFMVRTPTSRVIDLGTQFGINVGLNGASDIHMFKGKANLIAGDTGKTLQNAMLTAGEARRVRPGSARMEVIQQDQTAFVQNFDSTLNRTWHGQPLNLADIVSGGNGFEAGVLNRGLDPSQSGFRIFDTITTSAVGPQTFQPVLDSPYIDGIFVPDGSETVIISTSGLTFDGCPDTNGRYWGGVFNGAWHGSRGYNVPIHNLTLDGIVYGTEQMPAIYMHANQGITFDLDAIRRQQAGLKVVAFKAICGISETILNYPSITQEGTRIPSADFFILADGKPLFSRQDLPAGECETLDLKIPQNTRFLTLITTQGSGNSNDHDWTLFGRPQLIFERKY